MPTNPLVVFFNQTNEQLNSIPPVAFDIEGQSFDPIAEKKEALLIILDDHVDQIPQLIHTNCDKTSPLRVIWHNETDKKKKGLESYGNGEPTRVTGFSHQPGTDLIYDALLAILLGQGDVKTFVKKWQNTADLAVFDKLAAVIQLLSLVEPNTEEEIKAKQFYNALRKRCPDELKNSITISLDTNHYLKAVQAIEAHVGAMSNE